MSREVSRREMIPTGMLMKKIQRQVKLSVIQPPRVGPIAGAVTTATPYTANAMPRLAGGKVSARMACSLGCRPPPPAPCSTRQMISVAKFGASPHRKELMVNSATQLMMEESQPLKGRTMALETRYEVSTHVLSSCPADRLPAICGRATFAMEVS